MCGLSSEAIQKRLLTEKALTLDRAVETSVSMEMAAKEAHQLSSSTTLHKIANETYEKQIKCYSCDKMGHIASECWSKDLDCRICGKKGHFVRACKNKRITKSLSHQNVVGKKTCV